MVRISPNSDPIGGSPHDKKELPEGIIFDTCSGFASFGPLGRRLEDGVAPETGRNDYVSLGQFGGVANVHVVKVTKGATHVHTGYDEVYYMLSGTGTINLDQQTYPLRPGSVVVIPAGVPHSLEGDSGEDLEFIVFGTPPMTMDDDRARPKKL